MATIILSGVGGIVNWLPLVLPLVAIVLVAWGIENLVRFVKNRKMKKQEQLCSDAPMSMEEPYIETNV